MSKQSHRPVWLAFGAAALVGLAPLAHGAAAGIIGRKAEEIRREASTQSPPPRAGNDRPSQGSGNSGRNDRTDRGDRGRDSAPRNNPPQQSAPPRQNNPPRQNTPPRQNNPPRQSNPPGQTNPPRQANPSRDSRDDNRGRNYGTDNRRNDSRRSDDRGRDSRDYRPRRTTTIVNVLPSGYRNYSWNGTYYYFHGGSWYRPYGSSYITVGAPYGLFVGTLPGSYTSVWVSGTRYYYVDDTYYLYEPVRRGYVVARSPYGDDDYYDDDVIDEDLYIYPAQGQSEQQQADDRYECHRWAVHESGYDPIDDLYDAALRSEYLRAMTACLTGRGYSVR